MGLREPFRLRLPPKRRHALAGGPWGLLIELAKSGVGACTRVGDLPEQVAKQAILSNHTWA